MLDETAVPAADGATPPPSASRFTARSLQDVHALLKELKRADAVAIQPEPDRAGEKTDAQG